MNEIELAKSRLRGEGWDDSADAVERLEEQAGALTAAAGISPLQFAKYAVHQDLESYGHIALDKNGREASDDVEMSFELALYVAGRYGGYVVEVTK